jgi:hypothetical protein
MLEKNVPRLLEHNKEKKQGGGRGGRGWRKSHNEKIND